MSKYIDNNLLVWESVLYEWETRVFYYIPLIIWIIIWLISIILWLYYKNEIVIGVWITFIIWFTYNYIFLKTRDICITDKRFIYRDWIFINNSFELWLDKIESIKIEQDLIERILKWWKIIISWVWWNKKTIEYVARPEDIKNIIYENINIDT